jgi:hypothetical protein
MKILYKGLWTAFQNESEIDTNYVRILLHNHPDKMDIYGKDSMAGYTGVERGKLIAAAPELYNLVTELSKIKDNDLSVVYNNFIKVQEKAKKLLEKIDFKGGNVDENQVR